jgi:hypothetical protein
MRALTSVVEQVVRGAVPVDRAVQIGREPRVELEDPARDGIDPVLRDDVSGKRIARPRPIGQLASGGRIVDGIAHTTEPEVSGLHLRRRHRAEELLGLLIQQPVEGDEEEGLGLPVVNLGKDDRSAEITLRLHERRLARLVAVEEVPVLHPSIASE